ncbi:MAG: MFS transporter [Sphingomonas sp.]
MRAEPHHPEQSPPIATGEEVALATLAPPAALPVSRYDGPLLPMIIGTALFMQTLDSTVISNALPAMAKTLHQDPVTLNLAITAYLLGVAIFLPLSAWLADGFGAKRIFLLAIAGFAASSLLCGVARDLPTLVAARMLQGAAGAMMTPVGRLLLLRNVPKSGLVQAMAWLTMPALLGPILGPPIGGFIVTFLSWRWIFLINLPIGMAGIVLTRIFIPEVREGAPDRFDLRGFVLSGGALAGLIYGFDSFGGGMLSLPATVVLLVGGSCCAALYVLHARHTPHAVFDLALFRLRTFSASTFGGLFSRLLIGASPFLLALLLQVGFGLSAFGAGLLTFAGAVGALLMKVTARPIISRFGFRRILIVNALIMGAISASYALFQASTPHWLLVAVLLIGGFFRSLQFTAVNALTFADVPARSMSRASSAATVFQQLAQSLGIGIAAVLVRQISQWHGRVAPISADIAPVFAIVAALSLIAVVFYARLSRDAGAEISAGTPP